MLIRSTSWRWRTGLASVLRGTTRGSPVVPTRRRPSSRRGAAQPRGDAQEWHRGCVGLRRGSTVAPPRVAPRHRWRLQAAPTAHRQGSLPRCGQSWRWSERSSGSLASWCEQSRRCNVQRRLSLHALALQSAFTSMAGFLKRQDEVGTVLCRYFHFAYTHRHPSQYKGCRIRANTCFLWLLLG